MSSEAANIDDADDDAWGDFDDEWDDEQLWSGEDPWIANSSFAVRRPPPKTGTDDPRSVGRYLLSQLPLGAITLFELADVPLRGNWVRTVMGLVVAAVETGRAVLYTECGGFGTTCGGEELRAATGSLRFAEALDSDSCVDVPADVELLDRIRDQEYGTYRCGVPTLETISEDLDLHECIHGPALVVLDEIELARPWSVVAVRDELWALPAWTLTSEEADAWRARDLDRFAQSRTNAPTLVISDSPVGREEIRDRARFVIRSAYAEGEPETLTVAYRSSVLEEWSEPAFLTLPRDEHDPSGPATRSTHPATANAEKLVSAAAKLSLNHGTVTDIELRTIDVEQDASSVADQPLLTSLAGPEAQRTDLYQEGPRVSTPRRSKKVVTDEGVDSEHATRWQEVSFTPEYVSSGTIVVADGEDWRGALAAALGDHVNEICEELDEGDVEWGDVEVIDERAAGRVDDELSDDPWAPGPEADG